MLQRIEEQEREDEKAGFIQTQKTQKGRGVKQKKINLEEDTSFTYGPSYHASYWSCN